MDPTAKPLWESATFWGVLITALSGLLGKYGIDITPEDTKSLSAALVSVATPLGILAGLLVTIWGRVRATRRVVVAPSKSPTLSGLAAVALVCALAPGLSACTAAQLETAREVGMQVGRVVYQIECKSDVVGEIGGVVVASIKAPDSKTAATIRAGLAVNDAVVAAACPLARAVEIVVGR